MKQLKKINEDELLAKEDDGGDMGGGEVSAPGSEAPNLDVQTPSKPTGALDDNGVLGHCDHRKDGFFGPGCFHRPLFFGLFTRPIKKKKKKRKYMNILKEDEDFNRFANYCLPIAWETSREILSELWEVDRDFSVDIDEREFQEDDDRLAMFVPSNQVDDKDIPIAVNFGLLYKLMYESETENDELEITCQIEHAMWDAVGHFLLQYFVSGGMVEPMSDEDEDSMCREYADFHLGSMTGVDHSEIQDMLDKLK